MYLSSVRLTLSRYIGTLGERKKYSLYTSGPQDDSNDYSPFPSLRAERGIEGVRYKINCHAEFVVVEQSIRGGG
jgi:hypothetical protein